MISPLYLSGKWPCAELNKATEFTLLYEDKIRRNSPNIVYYRQSIFSNALLLDRHKREVDEKHFHKVIFKSQLDKRTIAHPATGWVGKVCCFEKENGRSCKGVSMYPASIINRLKARGGDTRMVKRALHGEDLFSTDPNPVYTTTAPGLPSQFPPINAWNVHQTAPTSSVAIPQRANNPVIPKTITVSTMKRTGPRNPEKTQPVVGVTGTPSNPENIGNQRTKAPGVSKIIKVPSNPDEQPGNSSSSSLDTTMGGASFLPRTGAKRSPRELQNGVEFLGLKLENIQEDVIHHLQNSPEVNSMDRENTRLLKEHVEDDVEKMELV